MSRMNGCNSLNYNRRDFLRLGIFGFGIFISNKFLFNHPTALALPVGSDSRLADIGKLGKPDKHGIRLPEGFSSRLIAESGYPVSGYTWHAAPDGGTTFPVNDGGWIYVSNSEIDNSKGGVGAIRFNQDGKIINAYSILKNTSRNCAGGPTPWNTWLSCEEITDGQVWECDPYGNQNPRSCPALGTFTHEAVAVDTQYNKLYLTEDQRDGCLYRFTPENQQSIKLDLDQGKLEVAEFISNSQVHWHEVPDVLAKQNETRYQIKNVTRFNGGEGIWFHQGIIYFTTKGDNKVWAYDTNRENLMVLYNANLYVTPQLTGVDNVTVSKQGDILVAEDGGNMEIVVITPEKKIVPLLQVTGQDRSEITGPAFSPDCTRLYFSSQRGKSGMAKDGLTYEISGPFI